MKKLIVFDWNGTLLSDARACMETDNHVLKTFGGKPVSLKVYRDTIIIPSINFYAQHGCNYQKLKKELAKVSKVFHSFYEPRAAKCRTRQGAKQLLSWLNHQSIKSVIFSNHTITGINNQLKRLNIARLISKVLANSSLRTSFKSRNKELKLKVYLKSHKYNPGDVFIVGDSPEEIEIGKALSIETVAITNGYYSEKRLKAAKSDFLIHNLNELKKIIKDNI